MEFDRQERPEALDVSGRPLVPSRVPETRPTPLQDWFIYLSVIVLICGTIAITALELGARLDDLVVRLPLVVGGFVLMLVTGDAMARVWRSAWAWLPIDRGRALFRLVWVVALVLVLLAAGGAFVLGLFAASSAS